MEDVSPRFLLVGVVIAGLILTRTAFSAPRSACPVEFKDLSFSAEFNWAQWNGRGQMPMKVQFGSRRAATGHGTRLVARVLGASGCQAVCEVLSFQKSSTGAPVSAELACRSPGFHALTSSVTVFWAHPKTGEPVIRFGRWLDGFEETSLRVELDQLSRPGARKLAARP